MSTCELQGLLKLFNNHVQAQHFFCRLLNAIYRLQLQKMDQIQANYPAIDLGDSANRIAYQITTEKDGDKVQHTLNQFVKHNLVNNYDILRILVIGKRKGTYKSVVIPSSLSFDWERDIIGVAQLVKHLETLTSPHLEEVETIIKEELVAAGGGGRIDSVARKSPKEEILEWLHQSAFREPLSQVLQRILRLCQIVGNPAVEHWARLELQGYFNEAGLTEADVVPEYRTIAGQYFDHYGRVLRVPTALHFVTCDCLRFGVGTLEQIAEQTEMQNISNPAMIDFMQGTQSRSCTILFQSYRCC